ncbi:MAG: glucosaminidase domain-containing protein [Chitinophagales bacterium]
MRTFFKANLCFFLASTFFFFIHTACANDDYKAYQYIDSHKNLAIEEMNRMGVPASIKLAQALLETNKGQSRLALEGRNHFGIKCKSYWTGDTIKINDDAPQECFRRYPSVQESYIDHSHFLMYHRYGHYSALFNLEKTDYVSWAYGLQRLGYATNKQYAKGLVSLIRRYQLDQYDRQDVVAVYQPAPSYHPTTNTHHASATSHSLQNRQVPATTKVFTPQNTNDKPNVLAQNTVPESTTALKQKEAEQTAMLEKKLKQENDEKLALAAEKEQIEKDQQSQASNTQSVSLKRKRINGIDAVLVNKETTLAYIAQQNNISEKKLFRYNEMLKGEKVKPDSPIYLAAKKSRLSTGKSSHRVEKGETLHDIAQLYGIKLKSLYKLNRLKPYTSAREGQILHLKYKAPKG